MMTPHKKHDDELCVQESRITRLEERSIRTEKKSEEHELTFKELNENIVNLLQATERTQATFDTLKWVITIMTMVFGAIFVFLVTELIKLIPPH